MLRFFCAVAVVLNFSFLLDQELLQLVVLVRSLVIVHGVVSRPCRRAGDYGVRHRLSAGGRKQETDGTTTTRGLRPTNAQFQVKNTRTYTRSGSLHTAVTPDDVRGIVAQIIQE